MMKFDVTKIPDELKACRQWVVWRSDKIPLIPSTTFPSRRLPPEMAKTNDPNTWSDFDTAVKYGKCSCNKGIGFVITPKDPFVIIDIDKCIDNGKLKPGILDFLYRLNSYTELSPSRTGLHIIIKNPYKRKTPNLQLPDIGKIEIYGIGQYVTITGHTLDIFDNKIREDESIIQNLVSLTEEKENVHKINKNLTNDNSVLNDLKLIIENVEFDDDFIYYLLLNNSKMMKLWKGDMSDYDNDHNRADQALLTFIANLSRNPEQIDIIFRKSCLMREEKWDQSFCHDEKQYTYGSWSIQKALNFTNYNYKSYRINNKIWNKYSSYQTNISIKSD